MTNRNLRRRNRTRISKEPAIQNLPDFVDSFPGDVVLSIFTRLDDLRDIASASAVSHSWRTFVINSGLSRRLCLREAPATSYISSIIENVETTPSIHANRDHKIYWSLLQALSKSMIFPKKLDATIYYRLDQRIICTRLLLAPFIWECIKQPGNLIIQLKSSVCIVTGIQLMPDIDEDYFEPGSSLKYVRFRMGHPKTEMGYSKVKDPSSPHERISDDYVWTYTSPEFTVYDEECFWQPFMLPEPILCIGGFVQIQMLNSDKEELDNLLGLSNSKKDVKIIGQPLSPAFGAEIGPEGDLLLLYSPDAVGSVLQKISQPEIQKSKGSHRHGESSNRIFYR